MNQETAVAQGNTHAKMKVTTLPFSAIPRQSRLFLDFLDDPTRVSDLYPNAGRLRDHPDGLAAEVLSHYSTERKDLCDALIGINTHAGAGPATLTNIEKLRDSGTVAVVTGQQAGLFSGPLYTIYKALSAIRFSGQLNERGIPAVPVFWVATEDHDMDEVAAIHLLDRTGTITEIAYRPEKYVPDISVGSAVLDIGIRSAIDGLCAALPTAEFSSWTRHLLAECYQVGTGFGEAFSAILLRLFGRQGLVILDPLDEQLKRLASPIYQHAIERSDAIVAAVRSHTLDLESRGYHAQVKVEADHFPLFRNDDRGQRSALRKVGAGLYRSKFDKEELTTAQLLALVRNDPTKISPNVMLRPVVQDYLLPTICYFGGAAEIAYFAQNSVVYETLSRPITPIVHRQSFTIIESKQRRAFEKLHLSFVDLFDGRDAITLRAAREGEGSAGSDVFDEVRNVTDQQFDRLAALIRDTDPTLETNLTTRRRKIRYHLDALKTKFLLSSIRHDKTARGRIDNLFSNLLPNGGLQERSLNAMVYLNKFGPGFIDWLYEAVDLNDPDHRIVEI